MVSPEEGLHRLRLGSSGAVQAAELLDLLEVLRILGARQWVRAVRSKLRAALERERTDSRQAKTQHRAGRVRLPDTRPRRRRDEGLLSELGVRVPAVVGAQVENRRRNALPDRDPLRLRIAVRNRVHVGDIVGLDDRLLAWG